MYVDIISGGQSFTARHVCFFEKKKKRWVVPHKYYGKIHRIKTVSHCLRMVALCTLKWTNITFNITN